MTATASKFRKRRVASDEAHAWARNLRLGNSHAKLVLAMLTGYVNGEGRCFVSIPQLAEDTELSPDTVRRRLSWLEEISAITRFPQWIDESGRRNSDGKGRRTTDEIVLMIEGDQDLIESKAGGHDSRGHGEEVSPSSQQGLTVDGATVSHTAGPALALEQPLHSGEGLTSEPEPEPEPESSPPTSPSGRFLADQSIEKVNQESAQALPHADSFAQLKLTWGHPVLESALCLQLWEAFNDAERNRFVRVVRGYNADYLAQKRPPGRCSLQKLMRKPEAWPDFEQHCPPDPAPAALASTYWILRGSVEFQAIEICSAIGRRDPPIAARHEEFSGEGVLMRRRRPLPAGGQAMADLLRKTADGKIDKTGWRIVDDGAPEFFAWSKRVEEWTGFPAEHHRIWLDKNDQVVPRAREADTENRSLPKSRDGLLVPETPTGFPPPKGTAENESV